MLKEIYCPKCGEKQWSVADNNYVVLFGNCWTCDKKYWKEGKLSLKEFEDRELKSVQSEDLRKEVKCQS